MGQMLESIRSEILLTRFHSAHPQSSTFDPTLSELSTVAVQHSDSNGIPTFTNGLTTSNPQPIPSRDVITHQTDGSNQSSTSTTPVSDTTATETDQSEAMAKHNTQQDLATSNDEQAAE